MTRHLLLLLCSTMILGGIVSAEDPLLRPGDRVALLGGTWVERAQIDGSIEAEWQARRPDWKLSVRNLGWSGDDVHGLARKRFDSPEDGFQRLLQDIETADPTVVLVAYGFSEASNGRESVERFESGLRRLVKAIQGQQRRIVLMTPFAMPGYRVKEYDRWMRQCRQIVAGVAGELDVELLSIDWMPTDEELTKDRLLPNAAGFAALANPIAERMVGGKDATPNDALKQLIVSKNQLFFHRYRPQNETYLFLFRKHEQGNNAVEIPQFDPLIRQSDERIWVAAGS
ncbi:MAG: GDSL-type esterase/lipase family protein [Planctomycetota bacterium]